MKFSCLQENLAQGLQVVGRISNKNINLPILNNVLIIADENLKLISTNLEIAVTCVIRAKIEEKGSFTIPAKLLTDYIDVINQGRIDLELKENEVLIKTGNDQSKIKGTTANDFPVIPNFTRENKYSLSVEGFKRMVQQVLFSAAKTESRPGLSGLLFDFNPEGRNGVLVVAATDSYRLAEKELKITSGAPSNQKIIVPAKTIQELLRIVSSYHPDLEGETPLEVIINENKVLFVYGPVELTSRLIDGRYPNYRQIIPTSFKTVVNLSIGELIKRVKAASLFSNVNASSGVSLDFKANQDQKVVISSVNGQMGESWSEMLCLVNGEDNKTLLNSRYLLDGLMNLGAEEAVLKIISGDSPCLLTAKDGTDYLYIIMPIRQ